MLATVNRRDPGVEKLWRALRKCYPTEEAAITAVERSQVVILPYLNSERNIQGCWKVVRDMADTEEMALEIITKNPGVLTCEPAQLAESSIEAVRNAANAVNAIESVLGPLRRLLRGLPGWDETADS